MKQLSKLLHSACVTTLVAAIWPAAATAAESEGPAQELVQVRASEQVMAAHWVRRQDSYVLQVVLDWLKEPRRTATATADQTAPFTPVTAAGSTEAVVERGDRGSRFIANTIANLRGLNPTFCGRTLTLVSGRRGVDENPTPTPPALSVNQPYPPRIKYDRVEVWLLKADGTQILPASYSCDALPHLAATATVEITYEFPLAGGEQAVAAAIRIGDNYYIEKLQPQVPRPAAL